MKIRAPFLAVLMLGATSQIAQVLFLRELLMVFHGNELSIGIILADLGGCRQSLGGRVVHPLQQPHRFVIFFHIDNQQWMCYDN